MTIPDRLPRLTPWRAFLAQRSLLAGVMVFGAFVNILVLTGPIFALQVYDRVLGSRSVETLVVLTMLMVFLFLMMGILDHVRKRIAARIGERLGSALEGPVLSLSYDFPWFLCKKEPLVGTSDMPTSGGGRIVACLVVRGPSLSWVTAVFP